jgi:hypothetical protein
MMRRSLLAFAPHDIHQHMVTRAGRDLFAASKVRKWVPYGPPRPRRLPVGFT